MAFDKKKFIGRFVGEATDHLAQLNSGLLKLEKNPDDLDTLNLIFRSAHTIKGSSRILSLEDISKVAHKLEDALDALRSKKISYSKELFNLLFKATDTLGDIVKLIESGQPVDVDSSKLCEDLEKAVSGQLKIEISNPTEPPAQHTVAVDAISAKTKATSEEIPRKKQAEPDKSQSPPPKDAGKTGVSFDKKKFITRFVGEATDHLSQLNEGLLKLERNPDDMEILNQVFRSAHTIKGSSRVLSLNDITKVAHRLEDALDALRGKKIVSSKELFNLLFKATDMLGDIVKQIQSGVSVDIDSRQLCEALEMAMSGQFQGSANIGGTPADSIASQDDTTETAAENKKSAPTIAKDSGKSASDQSRIMETVRLPIAKIDESIKLMGEIISNNSRMKHNLSDLETIKKLSNRFMELSMKIENRQQVHTETLINEISNLAQNLDSRVRSYEENTKDTMSIQSLLTEELREKVLKMRMFPLSTAVDSFYRMVRDMSSSAGKNVDLIMDGTGIELDKKVIEKIGDPLLHIVRNCFDHGIESLDVRVKNGKPKNGTIRLTACYEGGNVLIEVSDDGGGIPVEKIKEKALLKKLYDKETLDNMPRNEIINLIFRPGFSTSAIITDLSGRGVGMDVVKENIVEELKGSIEIKTVEGKGSTFYIRIPVTLAIVRALFIVASDLTLAIAVNAISEVVRIPKTEIIEVVNKRAIRLREQIIPVISLENALQLAEKRPDNNMNAYIVILSLGNEKLGLIIDTLINEEDIVMVALPKHMEKIDLVAGVTMVGKDEIVVLLHVPKLFALASKIYEPVTTEKSSSKDKKSQYILVVDDSVSTREIEKSILESYGYNVDLASDGMEGLEKAGEFQYDLVITDVEMPRMDGFSLTEKLRNKVGYKNTPVIIVTSLDKESDKKRGIQVGANAYIVKGSFDQSNLLNTVQNLIE